MEKMKVHLIGNAHLDPVWLWRWQEGFQENKATFQSALDRMKEYDDFVFTTSSAQFYEWIEENNPEMFQQIKTKIKEGRWFICGGWWVEPDCNIPNGESFARHGLLSQNYFKEKFGQYCRVGYNVDSFGHNAMLPQILQLSGMDYYVFMRPGPHEKGLPARNFIWQSDDGSQVMAFRIPYAYTVWDDIEERLEMCIGAMDEHIPETMFFYGVGNHGGGPTIKNIEDLKKIQRESEEYKLIFSDPLSYFEKMEEYRDSMPIVHDDLQHHASGCYSAVSEIKKYNKKAENALLQAERFSIMAHMLQNKAYPENYNIAWKNVLFNQFHDILPGSSIEQAYEDARDFYGESLSIAAKNQNSALQVISFDIAIPQDENMVPLVVFNSNGWTVKQPVEADIGGFGLRDATGLFYKVVDANGNEIPSQIVPSNSRTMNRHKVIFEAKVPAYGYSTLYIYREIGKTKNRVLDSQKFTLENQRFRYSFDTVYGCLKSIYDKKNNYELLKDICQAVVIQDDSDTWSHGVYTFDNVIGAFEVTSIEKIEDGPVRSAIRVISKYNMSILIQTYYLYEGKDELTVDVKVSWQEKHKMLKLRFPTVLEQIETTYEIPYGNITKVANGEEEAFQNWIDITGIISNDTQQRYGLTVINNSKPSASVFDSTIGLTVLRSPVFAHHDPMVLDDEKDQYSYTDQGIQEFSYQLVPHPDGWREAGIPRKSLEFVQPVVSIIESYHKGSLPLVDSLLSLDREEILITAVKKAEKSDDYVIRLVESYGKSIKAVLNLPKLCREISLEFKPYEIKTLLISQDNAVGVKEVNLLEWERK